MNSEPNKTTETAETADTADTADNAGDISREHGEPTHKGIFAATCMKIRGFFRKILNEEERAFLGKFLLVVLCAQIAVMCLTPVPALLLALPVLPIMPLIDHSHGDSPEGMGVYCYTVLIMCWILLFPIIFSFKKKITISKKILFSIGLIAVYALLILWIKTDGYVHPFDWNVANYFVYSSRLSISLACLHLAMYVFFCDRKLATRTIAFFVTYFLAIGAFWGVLSIGFGASWYWS